LQVADELWNTEGKPSIEAENRTMKFSISISILSVGTKLNVILGV